MEDKQTFAKSEIESSRCALRVVKSAVTSSHQ